MTATVGAGSQETLAAPPVPATPAQPQVEEAERRRQLLQALTTEHFTLQTARAATIADSNGRSALYLATVSSAIVALAFIGQVAHLGRAFHLFALALLPALVLLGVLTYLRLVQTALDRSEAGEAVTGTPVRRESGRTALASAQPATSQRMRMPPLAAAGRPCHPTQPTVRADGPGSFGHPGWRSSVGW